MKKLMQLFADLHVALWAWMVLNPLSHKEDWPGWESAMEALKAAGHRPRAADEFEGRCYKNSFVCEAASLAKEEASHKPGFKRLACDYCPLRAQSADEPCLGGRFKAFLDAHAAGDAEAASAAARVIRNMPFRDCL